LHSIKYCKDIDYYEWVISLMSDRKDLKASVEKVTQVSKAVAKVSEQKAVTVQAR
jgi:hypothetical protein